MTRAMLRRPFTALRSSGANKVPEYYGKSKSILTNKINYIKSIRSTFFRINFNCNRNMG
jgi:hypothetical protein